jgi:hypothetical protein
MVTALLSLFAVFVAGGSLGAVLGVEWSSRTDRRYWDREGYCNCCNRLADRDA